MSTPDSNVDQTVPHAARIRDYPPDGEDRHEVDHQAGDDLQQAVPELVDVAPAARHFISRAVRCLTHNRHLDQFIDIGTGLPTTNNTHQNAHRANAAARVLYFDGDPQVIARTQGGRR
ncbi:SAM-dependent methyltransferase [Actinomadura sp. NPDC048955]|uniref:SAM-dependent methyltransferase n=1 Tax=Actinomadura sp. NPDC048955 TaxID=3158228 RepID=UPI003404AE41